jgi:WD40 repeat protein
MLVSASSDKVVRLWDTQTGVETKRLEGHRSLINAVALSPDTRMLASGSDDKTVRLWDTGTGIRMQVFEDHTGPVASVAFRLTLRRSPRLRIMK